MNKYAHFILQQIRWSVGSVLLVLLALIFLTGLLPSDLQKVYAEENCIYLDEENGDDDWDGETEATAVQSFAKAKELAANNLDIKTIYVLSTVDISGEITLDGTNAILKRDPSFTGYLLFIEEGKEAVLHDITVDGGAKDGQEAQKSLIGMYGNLTIEDGTVLQNNFVTVPGEQLDAYGGAINVFNDPFHESESILNMTGGVIQNNSAYIGGGVCLWDSSTFNMSGGTIKGNKATGKVYNGDKDSAGGGIAAFRDAVINLSGDALITNNSSEEFGGGISLGTLIDVVKGSTLNMTGGTISENKAGSAGGGIYVQAGTGNGYSVANISAGKIIKNKVIGNGIYKALFGGGGIYVNGEDHLVNNRNNGILYLKNAVVKNNRSGLGGGGYASCPSSSTEINVKNGVGIFGNFSLRAQDVLIESGYSLNIAHSGSPHYSISPFMPGGSPYHWKDDTGEEVPLNKLSGILNGNKDEELLLHTDIKEDEAAESLAEVEISGNTSTINGGGIGSNGTVIMGEHETLELEVTKLWIGDSPENRPESITIELYRSTASAPENLVLLGTEKIKDRSGNWKLRFTNLPKYDVHDDPYLYTVKEKIPEGYSCRIKGSQEDGFILTNVPGISIPVEKIWIGENTEQVELILLADEDEVDRMTLSEREGWKASFSNLPKWAESDGHEILYTVTEEPIEGYSVSVSGTAAEGFTITNTKNPSDIPTPNPKPNPNPKPVPESNPKPTPEPNPKPTPTVAGESKPTPINVPILNSPVPKVEGVNRQHSRVTVQTFDRAFLSLWGVLFLLSGYAFLLWLQLEKRKADTK